MDNLLDSGGQQVSVGAGGKAALDGLVTSGAADIGEAFHQPADGFGDAILPSRPPRFKAQVRRMWHASVSATATGSFRLLIHAGTLPSGRAPDRMRAPVVRELLPSSPGSVFLASRYHSRDRALPEASPSSDDPQSRPCGTGCSAGRGAAMPGHDVPGTWRSGNRSQAATSPGGSCTAVTSPPSSSVAAVISSSRSGTGCTTGG